MVETDLVGKVIRKHALSRFRLFARAPLESLGTPSDTFCTVSDSLLEFISGNRDAVCRVLDGWVTGSDPREREFTSDFFVDNLVGYVHNRNQFIVIGGDEKKDLAALYDKFLAHFREAVISSTRKEVLAKRLREVLAAHQADLARFVKSLASTNGSEAFVFSEPISGGYSLELQLSILKADVDKELGPILDLGCGPGGRLVRYLRERGKGAMGVDRRVSSDRFLINADWLDWPLGSACWGTVISHMALSTHFLHHHLRPGGHPERYARRYMEILHSLKPGGSFLYAPGLPFIEDLLPRERYAMERSPVAELSGGPLESHLRQYFGTSIFYSCRVTRIPET